MFARASLGGLRRAEVVAIDLADFDAEAGVLIIRGKGNKERKGLSRTGRARLSTRGWSSGAISQGRCSCPLRKAAASSAGA